MDYIGLLEMTVALERVKYPLMIKSACLDKVRGLPLIISTEGVAIQGSDLQEPSKRKTL